MLWSFRAISTPLLPSLPAFCWLLEKRPLLTLFFIYSPHQYSCTPSLYLRSFEVISHCIKTREAGGKIAWEPTLIRPGKTESWRKSAIGFIPTAFLIHQTTDQYLTVIPTPTHSLAMHNPPTCPIAREGWGYELRGSRGYVWQGHHELIHFGSSQPLHYGIRCSRLHVGRVFNHGLDQDCTFWMSYYHTWWILAVKLRNIEHYITNQMVPV